MTEDPPLPSTMPTGRISPKAALVIRFSASPELLRRAVDANHARTRIDLGLLGYLGGQG